MKLIALNILLVAFLPTLSFSQLALPQAALTIKVTDDNGTPIRGAKAGIRAQETVKDLRRAGLTDESGRFSATLPSFGYLYFSSRTVGHYSAWGEYQFDRGAMGKDSTKWAESKWSPWNPTVFVVLKKKGQPIAMCAKWVDMTPPVIGKPVGYDMENGDWVVPYGKGKTSDLIFNGTGAIEKGDYRLTFTFSNPGDGIQVVKRVPNDARSELKSPKEAPAEGYDHSVTVDANNGLIGSDGKAGEKPNCLLLRIRTVLNEKGDVVSANYGKIYPGSDFRVACYFNPTANSRNLEYDPTRNLLPDEFGGLVINDP